MKKNNYCLLLLLFIFGIVLFSLTFFRIDPDYLWHIKAGDYMFHNGLVRHDVFSWYVSSKYWMSHEWLYEIILYSLKYLFGDYHIIIYCFSCILFLICFQFFIDRKDYIKNIPFSLLWIMLFIIICTNVQARPHLLSYCLLSITIYLLRDNYINKDSNKIYFLPIVSIIWANVHGGSSNLSYIFCFIFFISSVFTFNFNKIESFKISKKQLIKYLVVCVLCMIGVCINLHGFKMFIYPYQNMLDFNMLSSISEWRSTSLNEPYHYVYFVLLLFIFFTMLFSKKKIKLIHLILFAFCAFLGLKSIRFWFYTYIVSSYFIFYYVSSWKIEDGTKLGIIILSIVLCIMFICKCDNIINPKYHVFLTDEDISFVKSLNAENLFNMYDYGGELIYYDIPVFIDGRADLYSSYNYSDYLNISMLQGDFVLLLNKYSFDYLLVDKNYPLYTYLKYSDSHDLIYYNGDFNIFKRKESQM